MMKKTVNTRQAAKPAHPAKCAAATSGIAITGLATRSAALMRQLRCEAARKKHRTT